MKSIPFVKYHGAGNDFIMVDSAHWPHPIGSGLASWLCNRHFGIGADGVLQLFWEGANPRMVITNSDGSRAEMCGNGIRCFVRELVEHHGSDSVVDVITDAGIKRCWVHGGDGAFTVSVSMGPIYSEGGVDFLSPHLEREIVEVAGRSVEVFTASTGNPHAVLLDEFSRSEMEELGPALTQHARFPFQTNVEFVKVIKRNELLVIVHERGAGFTLACGTGSLAAAAVAIATGACDAGQDVLVHLPGGDLSFNIAADFSASVMEGPAERVFEGSIPLPERFDT